MEHPDQAHLIQLRETLTQRFNQSELQDLCFFYEELYRILKPFARYDLPETITIDTLKHITVAMRDWYFDAGGLYLTERARGPYFELKAAILNVTDRKAPDSKQEQA